MKKRNGRMGRAREEPEMDYGRRLKGKKSDKIFSASIRTAEKNKE